MIRQRVTVAAGVNWRWFMEHLRCSYMYVWHYKRRKLIIANNIHCFLCTSSNWTTHAHAHTHKRCLDTDDYKYPRLKKSLGQFLVHIIIFYFLCLIVKIVISWNEYAWQGKKIPRTILIFPGLITLYSVAMLLLCDHKALRDKTKWMPPGLQ